MDEYILKDAAIIRACKAIQNDFIAFAVKDAIKAIPAADVQEVVHGVWRYKTMTVPGGKGQTYAKWGCSNCKGKVKVRTNYCPNCGADMREPPKEET